MRRTSPGVLASAAKAGRQPKFGLNGFVIARESRKEAEETLREIVAKAHRPAVEGFRQSVQEAGASTKDGKGMWADSSFEDLVQYNDGFKTRLIGTPEEIADRIIEYKEVGVNLMLTCYLHFTEEVAAFGRDVLPIVREKEAELARARGTELNTDLLPLAPGVSRRGGRQHRLRHPPGRSPGQGRSRRMSQPTSTSPERAFGFRTRALHAGGTPDAQHGSRAVPIYQTTSFVFDDAADAANLFALQKYGNIYSRIGNPTVAAFEERIASLEGGIGAVATASGMSAEFITFAALVGAGDHVVASAQLYGGTVTQLDVTLRRFGVETTFVPSSEPEDYRAAFRPETKALYVEIIGNPSGEIADLEGLAAVAHEHGVPLVVDATLATPTWCGRSSTARTSSSTPPPSSSAGNAALDCEAWSSSPAASTGATASSPR